jgi:hypothetical protein
MLQTVPFFEDNSLSCLILETEAQWREWFALPLPRKLRAHVIRPARVCVCGAALVRYRHLCDVCRVQNRRETFRRGNLRRV